MFLIVPDAPGSLLGHAHTDAFRRCTLEEDDDVTLGLVETPHRSTSSSMLTQLSPRDRHVINTILDQDHATMSPTDNKCSELPTSVKSLVPSRRSLDQAFKRAEQDFSDSLKQEHLAHGLGEENHLMDMPPLALHVDVAGHAVRSPKKGTYTHTDKPFKDSKFSNAHTSLHYTIFKIDILTHFTEHLISTRPHSIHSSHFLSGFQYSTFTHSHIFH